MVRHRHPGTQVFDDTEHESVSTEQASITNETLLRVNLSNVQSITAGVTWETLQLDAEEEDERNEFDTTNHEFVPDETGWYIVVLNALHNTSADQDSIGVRLQDTTAGEEKIHAGFASSGAGNVTVAALGLAELIAGNVYEAQVRNVDSDGEIRTSNDRTNLAIRSAFR
jgi:hypothetical protein